MRSIDTLFVGFDYRPNGDMPALSVIRMGDPKATVINIFVGQEALDIYSKLTGAKVDNYLV